MMTRAVLLAALVACGSSRHEVRFANVPAVSRVSDRSPIAEPKARPFAHQLYTFRGNVVRRVDRGLSVRAPQRSLGVNALDEVPDSTWFTNRIGVRELSLAELRRGPAIVGSPEPYLPWTVESTKVGGLSIGFIITDARGEKFVLKFDAARAPELETAADVIVGKLLWAVGYNVPEDHVVYVRPSDLRLAPGAKAKDAFGNTRVLRRAQVDEMLAGVAVEPDGRIRGLASRVLDGAWLGGHPDQGTRADDANDRVPHERRRDLRGARAIFAWLDHVDVKEDNTLDMWVDGYVKHYWIDFGKALGATPRLEVDPRRGYTYQLDLASIASSFITAGLAPRRWDGRNAPELEGVGLFESATFTPAAWKPNSPSYLPFLDADAIDGYWGAKLLARFTPAQLRAVVETARLSDPRAVDYLTNTLVERQRISMRYWFSQVAPLDAFAADDLGRLCFDDLVLTYRLADASKITRYTLASSDRDGRAIGFVSAAPGRDGHTCIAVPLSSAGDCYTIIELRTQRHALDATTFVHLARRGGRLHVIGLWREVAS